LIFVVALYGAASFLLLGFAWLFDSRAFGRDRLPSFRGMPASYYRDACVVAILGAATWIGFTRLPAILARWPLVQHSLAASVPAGLDALNPAISTIATSVWMSFYAVALTGVLAGIVALYVRSAMVRVTLLVTVAM
jgi:hypothetical protein